MARVSFNLHPPAFMIRGPTKNTVGKGLDWIHAVLNIVVLMHCGWSLYMQYGKETVDPIVSAALHWMHEYYRQSVHIWSELTKAVLSKIQQNLTWTWMVCTALSGIGGFGTSMCVYSQTPVETIRI